MKNLAFHIIAAIMLTLVLLSACGQVKPEVIYKIVEVYISATPGPTATSTATFTPTATPTPTFTPTPTALPVSVSGDPRSVQLKEPLPYSGAPCGAVDTLDFPLDPPDGESASGGGDFGVYRSRYQGRHTGEDWRIGSSNFGEPVYSIGHGQVTYAQPLGWGRDQGVVILRHTFPNGRTLLSFYGHLDPPSVVLRVGDCVVRGDKVGEIGRPSSPPHLHFEIRTHLPDTPGPGYWSVDPAQAGWRPPSATIWNYRMATSPGAQWMRPYVTGFARGLGGSGEGTFILVEGEQLLGVDMQDGSLRWAHALAEGPDNALLDESGALVYLSTSFGKLEAYNLSDLEDGETRTSPENPLEPVWSTRLGSYGQTTLLPLPGGGVIVSTRTRMSAVSADGEVLWTLNPMASVVDWAQMGEALILTTIDRESPLWSVDETGPMEWAGGIKGRLVVAGEWVYVYADDGVYRLDIQARSAELVYSLSRDMFGWGDVAPLPDGGLLVAHADIHDRRLMVLEPDGSLRWERSLADLPYGQSRLLVFNDQAYLILNHETRSSNDLDLYAVDLNHAELTLIFSGGTRNPDAALDDNWAMFMGDGRLLINIGGGGMLALDPQVALEAMSGD